MKRSQLPALRMAMKNYDRVKDVARLPRPQRDVLQNYNAALQRAAFGSTASVGAIRRNIMNSAEVEGAVIAEETINESYQPPQVLVLRRTGIRIFPDGMRVAMYSNERMNVKFTVPFSATGVSDALPNVTAEEIELEEIMENLEQVSKFAQEESPKTTSRHMKFADGTKLKVSHGAAKAIHMVHGALNDENKQKFAEMLKNPKEFEKAANFALSKVDFTINKK